MRPLALLLLALASPARAGIIATSPNAAGGEIILTDVRGKCDEGEYVAITRAAGGEMGTGCWIPAPPYVLVIWSDGSKRMYDADKFTLTKEVEDGGF